MNSSSKGNASGGRIPDSARTTVDDLQKRGVKKVSVLTPDKIKQMIERRAAEMMEANKARILEKAQQKLNLLAAQNKQSREKLEALTERLGHSQRMLENERSKSFQQGTESQKAVIDRYQDEMLALKSRLRELEAENSVLLRTTSEHTQDMMTKYRQQIEEMLEDMRLLRENAPDSRTTDAGNEILLQYRDEIRQIRQQISQIGGSSHPSNEIDTDKMAAAIEAKIAVRLQDKIGTSKKTDHVPPKEVVLDNLFKDMPETNAKMVKIRQNKGISISNDLGKLKGFQEGREDLEIRSDELDTPQDK